MSVSVQQSCDIDDKNISKIEKDYRMEFSSWKAMPIASLITSTIRIEASRKLAISSDLLLVLCQTKHRSVVVVNFYLKS